MTFAPALAHFPEPQASRCCIVLCHHSVALCTFPTNDSTHSRGIHVCKRCIATSPSVSLRNLYNSLPHCWTNLYASIPCLWIDREKNDSCDLYMDAVQYNRNKHTHTQGLLKTYRMKIGLPKVSLPSQYSFRHYVLSFRSEKSRFHSPLLHYGLRTCLKRFLIQTCAERALCTFLQKFTFIFECRNYHLPQNSGTIARQMSFRRNLNGFAQPFWTIADAVKSKKKALKNEVS